MTRGQLGCLAVGILEAETPWEDGLRQKSMKLGSDGLHSQAIPTPFYHKGIFILVAATGFKIVS